MTKYTGKRDLGRLRKISFFAAFRKEKILGETVFISGTTKMG
jgi:hypothetical protein